MDQVQHNHANPQADLFIKMVIQAWDTQNDRLDKLIGQLPEERLYAQTAPGKNRGYYLLGHLVAISDAMIPLLGLGEKFHPELEAIFVSKPDNTNIISPSIDDLKKYWKEIISKLSHHFKLMSSDDWFSRHNAVSPEDFAREPFRNKLNIIINRTNHQSYHLGQMIYLK